MTTNAQSFQTQAARALNANGLGIVAQAEWLVMTHPYSYWDHKPDLSASLGLEQRGKEDAYFPVAGNSQHEFYYDIWSNIHFGYVSAAAGFDEATVQAGASVSIVAGANDAYDELSVHLGYLLWSQTGGDPNQLTAEMIGQLILNHAEEYRRIWEQVYGRAGTGVVIPAEEGNGR